LSAEVAAVVALWAAVAVQVVICTRLMFIWRLAQQL
jgi:hypothetical protein